MRTTLVGFITFIGTLASLVFAGDDCPNLELLGSICSCSQYRIDFPEVSLTPGERYTPTPKMETTPYNQSMKGNINMHNIKKHPFESIAATTAPKIRDSKYYTIVNCNMTNASRPSILSDLASILHRKWVDKLHVTNLPLDKEQRLVKLPTKWLNNVRITQFQIENCILSGDFILNGQPFAGQTNSLVWIAAIRCSLTGALTYDTLGTVNLRGLENFEHLEGIDLSGNHLVLVENSSFTHIQPELHSIVLSRNVLQKVNEGSFHNIPKLKYVDLSHNLLENFRRDVFSGSPNQLTRINLSWNRFQSLPENLFYNMSALTHVDFSNNFLYSLPSEPWKNIWEQLTWIDFSNNFIYCNCDLLWLAELNEKKQSVEKELLRGQCGLTLPLMYVRQFDLEGLKINHLSCDNLKDRYVKNNN